MGPFIKSDAKVDKMMLNVIIALMPIIIFAVYKNGYIPFSNGAINFLELLYPLIFILVGTITSFLVEFIYYKFIIKNDLHKNSYSIFPGLFLSLMLPIKTPIYVLVIGCIIASSSKLAFGGFGKNIFNPALVGYIILMILFSSIFTTSNYLNDYELDTISSSTPLTNASMLSDIGSYDKLVKPYGSLSNFFVGTIPGSLAETSSLLCVVALIFLIITKTIKWRIPVTYIFATFVITFGIGRLLGQGFYYPLFHIFSGGLMFGAIFMATDPVTSALTPIGQVLQGLFLAILTVIFRFIGVEGVAISILILNVFVFLFDKVGVQSRFNFMKALPWFILVCVLMIGTIISLAATKRVVDNKDPNFNVVSKEIKNNQTVYVVTQKGYGGKIKASVVFQNDKIISIEIISNNETKDRYQLVMDSNYLDVLIANQDNIEQVDTVSTATVTTNALKKLVLNVINEYN